MIQIHGIDKNIVDNTVGAQVLPGIVLVFFGVHLTLQAHSEVLLKGTRRFLVARRALPFYPWISKNEVQA